MAITKNESLQSLMNRSLNQGGVSFSLAGAKPNQANFVGTSSVSGGLTANTGGTVTPREYFSATQDLQNTLIKQRDRARNDQLMQGVKDARTAFGDTMFTRDQDNAQFEFAQDQARRSNAQNTINQGRAFHQSKVNAAQQWEAMSNQNRQTAADNQLERKKIRSGQALGLAGLGVEREKAQLDFQKAQLSDATNRQQIESTERTTSQRTEAGREVGNNQAQFGLFASLMNNLAAAPQGNRFGYLNI
jgi:hypothetical protein